MMPLALISLCIITKISEDIDFFHMIHSLPWLDVC